MQYRLQPKQIGSVLIKFSIQNNANIIGVRVVLVRAMCVLFAGCALLAHTYHPTGTITLF